MTSHPLAGTHVLSRLCDSFVASTGTPHSSMCTRTAAHARVPAAHRNRHRVGPLGAKNPPDVRKLLEGAGLIPPQPTERWVPEETPAPRSIGGRTDEVPGRGSRANRSRSR